MSALPFSSETLYRFLFGTYVGTLLETTAEETRYSKTEMNYGYKHELFWSVIILYSKSGLACANASFNFVKKYSAAVLDDVKPDTVFGFSSEAMIPRIHFRLLLIHSFLMYSFHHRLYRPSWRSHFGQVWQTSLHESIAKGIRQHPTIPLKQSNKIFSHISLSN